MNASSITAPQGIIIPSNKIVKPHEVPSRLLEMQTRLLRKMESEGGLPRFEGVIPNSMKADVLKEIYARHWKELKPFMHKDVMMIGGLVGKRPSRRLLKEIADVKCDVWGPNDGNTLSSKDYCRLLAQREKRGAYTPMFVVFDEHGEVGGAVFPIQLNTEDVTTHAHSISNHTYALDTITGPVLSCTIICGNGKVKGVGQILISKGVLAYATLLGYFKYISGLIAQSRPRDYGPEKRHVPILEHLPNDPNYANFHGKNGARFVLVVDGGSSYLDEKAGGINTPEEKKDGYGFIAGYTSFLRPSQEYLAVLEKIGKRVERLIA